MSNLNKLDFTTLEVFGRNHLKWGQYVKLHPTIKNLRLGIKDETDNPVSEAKKATAMIFIRRHIHDALKTEYLAEEDARALYVDDMNLIEIPKELERTAAHLKLEFEMKDLGKTRYCLGLEIEHCSDGILVHQSNYTQKVFCRFNKDKAKPSSTLIVIRSLDAKRDPFRPREDGEEILEPEVLSK
ncbi:uncharacterized protein [Pyrus communis]|uniref:uncharacterized protein n=1 Tax=Pyrus communis TaxID=23211 RepID=UPI0035BF0402